MYTMCWVYNLISGTNSVSTSSLDSPNTKASALKWCRTQCPWFNMTLMYMLKNLHWSNKLSNAFIEHTLKAMAQVLYSRGLLVKTHWLHSLLSCFGKTYLSSHKKQRNYVLLSKCPLMNLQLFYIRALLKWCF